MDDGEAYTGKVLSICMDYHIDNEDVAENDEYNGTSSYKDSIDGKGFCRDTFLN